MVSAAASATGSSEGHTAYAYKRVGEPTPLPGAPARDPLFTAGLDLATNSTLQELTTYVKDKIDNHFTSPRPVRRRRSTLLFNEA